MPFFFIHIKSYFSKNAFLLLFFIIAVGCRHSSQSIGIKEVSVRKSVVSDKAMVVSAHPLSSAIGIDIIKKGGNAIDAAVATQLALAVSCPRAGNIGGGGFMVVRLKDGSKMSLDFREKAPLAAKRDMYLNQEGNVIDGLSRNGHLAVGVPGTVAGLIEAHKKYGKIKDFKQLVQPAIELAAKGFLISHSEAERLNKYRDDFIKNNTIMPVFVKETMWKAGDTLIQKDLANTLRLIRDKGQDGFYKGETANKIIAEMQKGNGIISLEDLNQYQAKWRTPITTQYKDYELISMAPPSSGGIALAQMLEILEAYPIRDFGFQSTKSTHLMVEAERRAYADRAKHLGDSDFVNIPLDSLLQSSYLKNRMADFSPDKATLSENILAGNFSIQKESFETTHTSIIDNEGNAVSLTTTLNSNYGSKVVVEGAGFLLNNEMDDFSAKPGVPNQFGLVGNEMNAIEPQKRMLSSMTPTIIDRNDELFMVIGTPGGSTIITSVLQVFLNVAEFGMNLEEAIAAKRFHHQWLPDNIMLETNTLPDSIKLSLEQLGHQLHEVQFIGKVKAIQVLENGQLHGVGDPRNEDDHVESW